MSEQANKIAFCIDVNGPQVRLVKRDRERENYIRRHELALLELYMEKYPFEAKQKLKRILLTNESA